MGLLHRDEPVTDATVNCPGCRAIDWVVRRPRLGGEATIACRACGHVSGPYWDRTVAPEVAGGGDLGWAWFSVFVPDGLPWEPEDAPDCAIVVVEDPVVVVVTEPADGAPEPAEALRDAVADVLADDGPPPGRSHAAYLLEMAREDERIERIVGDLAVERGALRVEGEPAPCLVMRAGAAWAAHVELGDVVVTASARDVPIERVALVRHG